MKSGRKPLPMGVKELKGTARKCREAKSPQTSGKVAKVQPPKWLIRDAKEEWNRKLPLLLDREIVDDIDLTALAVYCNLYGDIREAVRRKLPVSAAVLREWRALGASFGFTPADRAALKLEGKKKPSNSFDRDARTKAAATLREGSGAILPGNTAGPTRLM